MKNEPLNLKEIKKLIEECAKNYEIFGDALIDATFIDIKNHLKSAVQGLLQEIDKLPTETIFDKVAETKDGMAIAPFEFIKKKSVIDLIKKWFPDVVEEGEK